MPTITYKCSSNGTDIFYTSEKHNLWQIGQRYARELNSRIDAYSDEEFTIEWYDFEAKQAKAAKGILRAIFMLEQLFDENGRPLKPAPKTKTPKPTIDDFHE
jgi:hypothetical protein